MLPEPLWPGIEFAWAEMIRADCILLFPELEQNSQVQDFESICLNSLLHHWEGEEFLPSAPSSLAFLHLSLQLAGCVNHRVNPKAHGHWEEEIFT